MKPKWKETEFWLQVAVLAATALGVAVDYVSPDVAAILLAVQAAMYTWYRQTTKRRPSDEVLRGQVFTTLQATPGYGHNPGGNGTTSGGAGGLHHGPPANGPGSNPGLG